MSVSFDWDVSEEIKRQKWPDDGRPPDRRRRWLRRVILGFVLISLVVLAVGSWVRGRLKSVERRETELRAVVEVELKAIAEGDAELFRSRQDLSDVNWLTGQLARYFSADAALFGPAPGLMRADQPAEIKEVHYFGRGGRVELTQFYQDTTQPPGATGDQATTPLTFHTTWFYRQAEDGTWYHVAPPEDYWGIPYSWYGTRLVIRATEIEAGRLDVFADELTRLAAQMCLWIECPGDDRFTLSFMDVPVPQIQDDLWMLPALYLTGLPEGEEAWVAWKRAMKLWVVQALARAQLGDERLAERIIYRQLVKRLQAEFGLTEAVAPDVELLAQALREGEQPPLWSLWEVKPDPDDPHRTRISQSAVAALLDLVRDQTRGRRIYRLLPALSNYAHLGSALTEVYQLDRTEFSNAWLNRLSRLTGTDLVWGPDAQVMPRVPFPLGPPPTPFPPAFAPGDELVFNCGGQIWVSNADGSGAFPLTSSAVNSDRLLWSPDGRWLVTTWQPYGVLYLVAIDGVEGRLLTTDLSASEWPVGWSPDGRKVIYISVRSGEREADFEVYALDILTGESEGLPGLPVWSPDGKDLVYVSAPPGGGESALQLADGNWAIPSQIAAQGFVWPGKAWSPDSSRLALILDESDGLITGPDLNAVAIYEVAVDALGPTVTPTQLTEAFLSTGNALVTDGTPFSALLDEPFNWLLPLDWSADGGQLLVWAQSTRESGIGPMGLAAIPLEVLFQTLAEPAAQSVIPLLYGEGKDLLSAAWSPGSPSKLSFTWSAPGPVTEEPQAFVLDVQTGEVYTAAGSWGTVWSPDGDWLALGQRGRVIIVDQAGVERFSIVADADEWCTDIAWNPVADLSELIELSAP